MSAIKVDQYSGGIGLTALAGTPEPSLAEDMRDVADDLAGVGVGVPAWTTGVTVTANVAVLAQAGFVVAVHATAGTTPGPKQMIQGGSPAAGQVDVAYDANGLATLTFNGTDAITATAVVVLSRGSGATGYTIKTTAA